MTNNKLHDITLHLDTVHGGRSSCWDPRDLARRAYEKAKEVTKEVIETGKEVGKEILDKGLSQPPYYRGY